LDFEEITGGISIAALFAIMLLCVWLPLTFLAEPKPSNTGADVVRTALDFEELTWELFGTFTVTVLIVWLPAPSVQSIVIV
jgi:hypothetical protein